VFGGRNPLLLEKVIDEKTIVLGKEVGEGMGADTKGLVVSKVE